MCALSRWIQTGLLWTKSLLKAFPKYKTLYLIIAYPVHEGRTANVRTINMAAVRRMQQSVIWYLLRVKHGSQHNDIPAIRTVTTFNLKKTLIPSLVEMIKKEYVHIDLEKVDDPALGLMGVADDDARTQWNVDAVDSVDGDDTFLINSYLDGHQTLAEQMLCRFPSLNPFSAQRMIQSNLTLKV